MLVIWKGCLKFDDVGGGGKMKGRGGRVMREGEEGGKMTEKCKGEVGCVIWNFTGWGDRDCEGIEGNDGWSRFCVLEFFLLG